MANVLAVIQTVAAVIKTAVDVGNVIISTVEDAEPFAKVIVDTIGSKEEISDEELDAMRLKLQALSNELQKPLPPE